MGLLTTQGNFEDGGPEVSAAEAAHHADGPAPDTVLAMDRGATDGATTTAREAAEASSSRLQIEVEATSPDDRDALEVVLGCPCLRASVPVSLPETVDTAYSALRQVRDVFHRERADLEAEQLHLKEWSSLMKSRTKSEKEKAVKKREHLDAMEDLLKEEQVAIGVLKKKAHKLLKDAKELHAAAKARANTNIKQQEDLNQRVDVVSQREQKKAQREQELQEKEEEIADMLERERDDLMSHDTVLSACETAVEAEDERLRKMCADLLNRELAIS
jgi:DNA repair exonuclease SbcCD ATPase subunit